MSESDEKREFKKCKPKSPFSPVPREHFLFGRSL
jgi:hypothetical protein